MIDPLLLIRPAFAVSVCILVVSRSDCGDSVQFRKQVLTGDYYCDGVAAADFNNDGHVDVVAGPFWFEGPELTKSHEIYPPVPTPRAASPSDSMFSFTSDFNSDGYVDVLVLGRVHKHAAYWYENPGATAAADQSAATRNWKKHYVFERIRGESPAFGDLDGDGIPQLVCHWEGRWGYIQPDPDSPTLPWQFTPIGDREDWPQFYHGTGIGDINSDGRIDVVINDGWYEQPLRSNDLESQPPWIFHRTKFSQQRGGAQIYVDDIDGDDDADVISALHAHEWGLGWFEQLDEGNAFRLHTIMGDRSEESKYGVAFSQPHALEFADINGDGRRDIVIGKRRWAHGPTGDVEPSAPPVVYWFENTLDDQGEPVFKPHQIDDASGVGTQICVADINRDGRVERVNRVETRDFRFLFGWIRAKQQAKAEPTHHPQLTSTRSIRSHSLRSNQ